MRPFKFIKWWWNRSETYAHIVGCYTFLWVIPCAIASIWAGEIAFAVMLAGIALAIPIALLYHVYEWFCYTLRKFKEEVPADDVEIIRRLKGDSTWTPPGV